jgi:hemin uptake protein HemP
MIEEKDSEPSSTRNAPVTQSRAVAPPVRRTIKSSDLLAGENELLIEHNGGVYSLRETSNGKLILTK